MNSDACPLPRTPASLLTVALPVVALLTFLLTGCASLDYRYPIGSPLRATSEFDLKIGVMQFADKTDGRHYSGIWHVEIQDPGRQLAREFTGALAEAGKFAEVSFLDRSPAYLASQMDFLRQEGYDAVFIGDINKLKFLEGPQIWSVFPPMFVLWPLCGLGIPVGPLYHSAEVRLQVLLVSLSDGRTLWSSSDPGTLYRDDFWGSWSTGSGDDTRPHQVLFDRVITNLRDQVVDTVGRTELATLLEKPAPAAASAPSPVRVEPRPAPTFSTGGPGAKYALVIGISSYEHSGEDGLANLLYADKDAHDFADTLQRLGWQKDNVKLLQNEQATERNIRIALESWLSKTRPEDLILLYWAGHGYSDPEDPEKIYFACHDTDIRVPATGFRMDRVRGILAERRARNVIVLADTCHAGKLITRSDGMTRSLGAVMSETVARPDTLPPGWIFMVGAESDRTALEHSSWSNGAFTHCLLEALSGSADGYMSVGPKDGVITMGEVREYLRSSMPEETLRLFGKARHPLITTNSGDPQIWSIGWNTQ